MIRIAASAAFAMTMAALPALSACGPGGGADGSGAPAKTAHVLTDAERVSLQAALPAPYNAGDLANGRRVFARCRSCHTITEGGRNMTGPALWGVFGRTAGTHPGFRYSEPLKQAGFVWDAARLDQWLQSPRGFLPGNKMSFAGLSDATDRRDVIAFLKVETGYGTAARPNPAS